MNPILDTRIDEALRAAPRDSSGLHLMNWLRRRLPADVAREAALLAELRERAARRFPTRPLPYLTRRGLAQASSEAVAARRAARLLRLAPGATTLDATCGVGSDCLALALAGGRVVASDRARGTAELARANLAHHGLAPLVVAADAARPAVRADLLLVDPDRRDGERRLLDPEAWSPALSRTLAVVATRAGACIKLAPAMDPGVLEAAEAAALPPALPRRREWLSRGGELVEVALWTGVLAGETAPRVATRLEASGVVHEYAGTPQEVPALAPEAAAGVAWISDPDPALLRAGLLGTLAADLDLASLGPRLAYLGGGERPRSPFLRSWRVLGSAPLDRKRVRALLAEHDIGPVSVRKRGHPDPPEALERRLRGQGSRRGELVIARLERGHRAYLVEPATVEPEVVGDEGLEPPTSSL